MKNWISILLVVLLMFACGVAGYFIHQPNKPESFIVTKPVADPIIVRKNDSLKIVIVNNNKQIDSLKLRLSRYGVKPKIHDTISYISLPCDTGHIVKQLQDDIRTWQDISTIQDTINEISKRFNVFLTSELENRNATILELQLKYDRDIAELKRKKKNLFLTFGSITAAFILSALLFK